LVHHVGSLVLGYAIGLVVAGPTFFVEEFWHGRPLIDQGGIWWVIPAAVMAIGFFVGGWLVGRRCHRLEWALVESFVVASATVFTIFAADVVRRHQLGQYLNPGVDKLWALAGVGAIVVGVLGGLTGRRYKLLGSKSSANGGDGNEAAVGDSNEVAPKVG